MIIRLQVAFIVIVSIMVIVSLLMGCGGKSPEDNGQCTNCNNDECDIMYVSPEIKDYGTGGIK